MTSSPLCPLRYHSHLLGQVIVLSVCGLAGCGNRAHNELYQQRLASEVRTLEDQLYEADYHNRVLRDEVERMQLDSGCVDSGSAGEGTGVFEEVVEPRRAPSLDSMPEMPDELEFELGKPESGFDFGQPDSQSGAAEDAELIPPSQPEPPGKDDLELPKIVPGEPAPPPGLEDDGPLGRVELPDELRAQSPQAPTKLRIHPGLSGGHRFDDDENVGGLFLVVSALDALDRTVDLNSFDVAGEMTVVVLDPQREGNEARIGRWDFSADQVRELIRQQPASGFHIPVRWQESEPASDEVVVHVRLRADEDEMRCEANLKTGPAAAMAKWTPRGERL